MTKGKALANISTTPVEEHQGWHAYVDGSFSEGVTTFGVVIIHDNKVLKEVNGCIPPEREGTGGRQIVGELWSAMLAVKWMENHGIFRFTLHYDYSGIRHWASELWRARQDYAIEYVEFMASAKPHIQWDKIGKHNQNVYSDRVHNLANDARIALLQ